MRRKTCEVDANDVIQAKRQNLILELLRFAISGKGNGQKTALQAALNRVDKQPALDDLRRQLAKQQRNLSQLKDRKANYGVDAPLSLLNQIEAIEAEIKILEQEIDFGDA